MSSMGEQYAAFQMNGYDPDEPDRCGNCGSERIWWDPADGWCCGSCHATDADET
jgi:ribosomal protein S27AE